ncbi:site-specific integrase [Aquiluna sp. KACHI24]|uniref:tyrosine-type recombinase/integrase n=1 Tax=Aquiluna sp. KACHI24 TaxID=2968831 RepID=UPI00220C3D88|nr:site-specific integrase [Aquiluna sp. KACHI24]BDQ00738.1 site-specific integrase [Aquiluna sp. KACHI24]
MRDGTSVWYSEKHKRWIFQVSFRDSSGKRRAIQRRAKTKSEAERRAIDLARSPNLKSRRNAAIDVQGLIARYVEFQKMRVRSTSLANSVHLLRLYVVPVMGNRSIEKVDSAAIEDLMSSLAQSNLRTSSINTVRAKLHALFAFAVRQGILDSNPVAKVPRYSESGGKPSQVQSPWTLEEASAALAAFRDSDLEAFLLIALSTGMRKGEILALRWSDVNFANQTLKIQRSRGERRQLGLNGDVEIKLTEGAPKTQASVRTLPMSDELAASLLQLRNHRFQLRGLATNEHIILGANGAPMSPSYLTRAFNRKLKEAGLRRIRIHDLRHTVAHLALEAGVLLEEISQGFGHSGVEITKRTYASVVQALSDRFAKKVSTILFE